MKSYSTLKSFKIFFLFIIIFLASSNSYILGAAQNIFSVDEIVTKYNPVNEQSFDEKMIIEDLEKLSFKDGLQYSESLFFNMKYKASIFAYTYLFTKDSKEFDKNPFHYLKLGAAHKLLYDIYSNNNYYDYSAINYNSRRYQKFLFRYLFFNLYNSDNKDKIFKYRYINEKSAILSKEIIYNKDTEPFFDKEKILNRIENLNFSDIYQVALAFYSERRYKAAIFLFEYLFSKFKPETYKDTNLELLIGNSFIELLDLDQAYAYYCKYISRISDNSNLKNEKMDSHVTNLRVKSELFKYIIRTKCYNNYLDDMYLQYIKKLSTSFIPGDENYIDIQSLNIFIKKYEEQKRIDEEEFLREESLINKAQMTMNYISIFIKDNDQIGLSKYFERINLCNQEKEYFNKYFSGMFNIGIQDIKFIIISTSNDFLENQLLKGKCKLNEYKYYLIIDPYLYDFIFYKPSSPIVSMVGEDTSTHDEWEGLREQWLYTIKLCNCND